MDGEVVDQRLGVRGSVGDDSGEVTGELGVGEVEPLGDELGVLLGLGEDDRLAEPVTAGDLVALHHQRLEDLVDGVLVEQEPVELLGTDLAGRAVLAPVEGIPLVLLVLGEVVVLDAGAQELGADADALGWDQVTGVDGFVEGVVVGGDAVLEVEEPVGVVVDLVLGRRGEADEERVEVVEDRAVLGVDRAVGLVDDDEVEVAGPEAAVAVVDLIDEVHHRGVRRDVDASLDGLLGDEVDRGRAGQVLLEGVGRLVDQGGAVGEEQDPLDPVRLLQQVDQGDGGAGLARSGGHHQQRLALLAVERIADCLDGAHLVGATGDVGVRLSGAQRELGLATLDQQFEFVAGVEALGLARWVAAGVVPDPVLVAVGIEDDRSPTELRLEAIGVELGLLLADFRRLRGPLGLDHRQGESIRSPQNVVDEPVALGVGHTGDRVLPVTLLLQRPAGLVEQDVDEQVAGGGLVVVTRVRCGFGLGCGDLSLQLGDLRIARRDKLVLLGQRAGVGLVLLLELGSKPDDVLARQWRGLRSQSRVKLRLQRHHRRRRGVVVGRPDDDVEQLAQHRGRHVRADLSTLVHRGVGDAPDRGQLLRDPLRHLRLERGIADLGRQVVAIRER